MTQYYKIVENGLIVGIGTNGNDEVAEIKNPSTTKPLRSSAPHLLRRMAMCTCSEMTHANGCLLNCRWNQTRS